MPTKTAAPKSGAREALPLGTVPMLATLTALPAESEPYAYEYKWDGVRALAFWDGRHLRLESRNSLDLTAQYPELQGLGPALGRHTAALDGEIVAIDRRGRVSFSRLAPRMHLRDAARVARLAHEAPVTYMVFDVLHLDGRSTRDLPYLERRRLLEGLKLQAPHVKVPPSHVGEGAAMFAAAREQKLEGVIAKRVDSHYEPGRRSRAWLKVKVVSGQEFVVGGWTPLLGDAESVGALLLGYYEPEGRRRVLRYAGRVGTGFSQAARRELGRTLRERAQEASPFADETPRGAHFARPDLVAEVEFREWNPPNHLRHPAFKGLRTDKPARKVVRETTQEV